MYGLLIEKSSCFAGLEKTTPPGNACHAGEVFFCSMDR